MLKISSIFSLFFSLFIFNNATVFARQKQDTIPANKGVRIDMQKPNEDTVLIKGNNKSDTSGKNLLALDTAVRKKFNPKIATLRSAIIPGWGQAYNKKYWKIPIVYGALGTTAGVFFYNLKTYKLLRQAVVLRSDTIISTRWKMCSSLRERRIWDYVLPIATRIKSTPISVART